MAKKAKKADKKSSQEGQVTRVRFQTCDCNWRRWTTAASFFCPRPVFLVAPASSRPAPPSSTGFYSSLFRNSFFHFGKNAHSNPEG